MLSLDRTDYVLRSLSKISSKRWEHYAINRIFHRLNDPEIEFVCQQCIRKNDKKIYLADLYFPQLGIYLEIDEGHHDSDDAKILDATRRFDIAEASGLTEKRLPASGVSLDELNNNIETFVDLVVQRKAELVKDKSFTKWDYEHRFTAAPHLQAGFIEIGTHSAFRTHSDPAP